MANELLTPDRTTKINASPAGQASTLPPQRAPLDQPATINVSALGTLVSILIPCCGMREYTSLLVPNLLKQTRPPFELIFLDVGSLDGTAEYLEGLAAGLPNVRIEIVRAATDLDLGDATKDVIAKVRGDHVVLLNNDTVVTNGWLNQMLG